MRLEIKSESDKTCPAFLYAVPFDERRMIWIQI